MRSLGSMSLSSLVAVAVLSPTAASASLYGRHKTPVPSVGGEGPAAAQNIDVIEHLGDKVPRGLMFVDGHRRNVGLDDLLGRGKPVIVTLGYYKCPMLCNLVHQGLVKAIKETGMKPGQDFYGVSISINPDEDPKDTATQEGRLQRAIDHNNPSDWPFLIDPKPGAPNAAALAKAVGFRYVYDEASKQYAHAAVAFILTETGTVARYLYGVDFQPRDFRFALVEAGRGRVGTALDRVLLACFRYDPMTQKYTPYAMAFVRIGAGLCAIALFTLLAVLWRREWVLRRQRRLA